MRAIRRRVQVNGRIHMRLLFSTLMAVAALLVGAGPGIDLVAAPNNRPRDIKVKIALDDAPGDKIQSDGGGPYEDGVSGVVAYIAASANGALIFGTNAYHTPGRTLQFVFDNCLSLPADCDAPWPFLNEASGLLANVLRGGVTPAGGLLAMTTAEGELPMWIKFNIPLDSDPAFWNVCFDSRKTVGPCGLAPGATSTDARIIRIASDEWTIRADATSDRADLIRDSQTKKNRTFEWKGTYSLPFSLTVKCVDAADCP